MNCDAVTNQLPLMLYGELSFDEEELVQQHLDVCAACRQELQKTRTLHEQFDLAEIETPPVLLADCRRNLRLAAADLRKRGKHGPCRFGTGSENR